MWKGIFWFVLELLISVYCILQKFSLDVTSVETEFWCVCMCDRESKEATKFDCLCAASLPKREYTWSGVCLWPSALLAETGVLKCLPLSDITETPSQFSNSASLFKLFSGLLFCPKKPWISVFPTGLLI